MAIRTNNHHRLPAIWIAATSALLVVHLAGCRSAAHQDLYVDELAAEVRFLEDQLYQIDYENKILREKLARLKRQQSQEDGPPRSKSVLGLDRSRRNAIDNSSPSSNEADTGEPNIEIEAPEIQLGNPIAEPPAIPVPNLGTPSDVLPPEDSELIPPAIDTGELALPPDTSSQRQTKEQIEIPGQIRPLYPLSSSKLASLELDTAGGQSTDASIHLLIRGLDRAGDATGIETPVEIAIIDPENPSRDNRLGLWNVAPKDLQYDPKVGYSIELRWNVSGPVGENIVVHCRTQTQVGEVRTDRSFNLRQLAQDFEKEQEAKLPVAQMWTPRETSRTE